MPISARFRQLFHQESGMTLVEMMIATIILGVVLASFLTLISQSFRYLGSIRKTARSSQVLQQKMEDIRLLSWSAVQALPSTFSDPNDTQHIYAGYISKSDYDTYNGTTTVQRITLTVTWTNQTQRIVTNSLTTLISCGGLNKYIF